VYVKGMREFVSSAYYSGIPDYTFFTEEKGGRYLPYIDNDQNNISDIKVIGDNLEMRSVSSGDEFRFISGYEVNSPTQMNNLVVNDYGHLTGSFVSCIKDKKLYIFGSGTSWASWSSFQYSVYNTDDNNPQTNRIVALNSDFLNNHYKKFGKVLLFSYDIFTYLEDDGKLYYYQIDYNNLTPPNNYGISYFDYDDYEITSFDITSNKECLLVSNANSNWEIIGINGNESFMVYFDNNRKPTVIKIVEYIAEEQTAIKLKPINR